jgi:DNA topoisomerase VI subunit B
MMNATTTTQELTRTAFKTSRLMEFFTESELTQQIGQSKPYWRIVALKELIDNALDACENAGIPPEIEVRFDGGWMTVADNAGGIPDAVIKSSLDYMVRVSDKFNYISPTRGQLGNALKCIYAAPYVMDGEQGHVRIETRGTAYDIFVTFDRIAQEPVLTLRESKAQGDCTKVMIEWPDLSSLSWYPGVPSELQIVQNFAMLNPHAEFKYEDRTWKPTMTDWQKWKTNNPTSPHWYTAEQLRNLIAAYLNAERESNISRTVREFVSEFRGLSRTATQKTVCENAGLHGKLLADLVGNGDVSMPPVERLLSSMKEACKPVQPKLLGIIGKEHLAARMVADHGVEEQSIRYVRKLGKSALEPYVLEVAFGIYRYGEEKEQRTMITGLNWSPTIDNPIYEIREAINEMSIGFSDPVCLVIHIAKPHFEFTERGKGHANV